MSNFFFVCVNYKTFGTFGNDMGIAKTLKEIITTYTFMTELFRPFVYIDSLKRLTEHII